MFHHAGVLAFGPRLRTKAAIFSVSPLVFVAFEGLGQMNNTKDVFKNDSFISFLCFISLSSKRHMSLCPCCVPPALCVVVLCSFMYPCCLTDAHCSPPSFLPSLPHFSPSSVLLLFSVFLSFSSFPPSHLPLSSLLPQPAAVPYSPLRCTHLCDRLLLTHSTSAALQMRAGRAKGQVPCRAKRTAA